MFCILMFAYMKKIVIIVSGLLFLAVTSCQKEVIKPVTTDAASGIEWKSDNALDQRDTKGNKQSSDFDKAYDPNSEGSGASNEGQSSGSGITDPNNDPDSAKKKGKK